MYTFFVGIVLMSCFVFGHVGYSWGWTPQRFGPCWARTQRPQKPRCCSSTPWATTAGATCATPKRRRPKKLAACDSRPMVPIDADRMPIDAKQSVFLIFGSCPNICRWELTIYRHVHLIYSAIQIPLDIRPTPTVSGFHVSACITGSACSRQNVRGLPVVMVCRFFILKCFTSSFFGKLWLSWVVLGKSIMEFYGSFSKTLLSCFPK